MTVVARPEAGSWAHSGGMGQRRDGLSVVGEARVRGKTFPARVACCVAPWRRGLQERCPERTHATRGQGQAGSIVFGGAGGMMGPRG